MLFIDSLRDPLANLVQEQEITRPSIFSALRDRHLGKEDGAVHFENVRGKTRTPAKVLKPAAFTENRLCRR